ncbi:MAG TPA: M14 family metallopeptidase [Spirochaetia bacterium]|nr:M14 family metallopeptidase [Spirochaetia bacterium]
MKRDMLFRLASPGRDDFVIWGYRFGSGAPAVAIIAGMRGSEIQQMAAAAHLVRELELREHRIAGGQEILVIPAANPFSFNVGRRFWSLDNTDVNRMFPGYAAGETTQRIARALMDVLTTYEYGINLTSINQRGQYVNHVRIHSTGYENVTDALKFGFRYLHLHEPNPQETGSLNYNWQIWNTKAYSLLGGQSFAVDTAQTDETVRAILRFLRQTQVLEEADGGGFQTEVVTDNQMHLVWTEHAGLWQAQRNLGDEVSEGEQLGVITDSLCGRELSTVVAPASGRVFYREVEPLVTQRTVSFVLC